MSLFEATSSHNKPCALQKPRGKNAAMQYEYLTNPFHFLFLNSRLRVKVGRMKNAVMWDFKPQSKQEKNIISPLPGNDAPKCFIA